MKHFLGLGLAPVYAGMEIIVNDVMTGANVRRSFKERFFSWPWRPWVKTRFDPLAGDPLVPDGEVWRLSGTNKIIMNSRTKIELEHHLQIAQGYQ